jgi:hypothetical protein
MQAVEARRVRHASQGKPAAPVGAGISIESDRRSDGLKGGKRL